MRQSLRLWQFFLLPVITLCSFLFTNAQTKQEAKQILSNYLTTNAANLKLQQKDFSELEVTSTFTDKSSGIQHIYAQQRLNGIDIIGGVFALHSATTSKKQFEGNDLIKVNEYERPNTSASISFEQAVRKALKEANHPEDLALNIKEKGDNKIIYQRSDNDAYNIPARKVYLPVQKTKQLQLAYEVQMFDAVGRHYWVMYFDAVTGKLLKKKDAIIHCTYDNHNLKTDAEVHQLNKIVTSQAQQKVDNTSVNKSISALASNYRVFPLPFEAPNKPGATHSLVSTSGDGVSSPDGWHQVATIPFNYTRGNNVWAFYDPGPTPLGGAPNPATVTYPSSLSLVEPFNFDYPFNETTEPENSRNAAIVNLFYWNNLIHDVFYHFGFDENLNFQDSHLFSSGIRITSEGQGDAVLAQAQDGGGTNNANFLTLPDGVPGSGQMQMYLFTTSVAADLVHVTSSTSGTPSSGSKYNAIQGSFNTLPIGATDLYNAPVLNKEFVVVQKNPLSIVGSNTEGCTTGQQSIALPPGNTVTDKIVLIDRGNCSFAEKILGAQLGGAAGVIIINNIDGGPIAMGGTDAPANLITIPAVMISKADGAILKAALSGGATIIGSLKKDTPNAPKKDGDFDNGVISHEYGHGISNRLTGGGDVLLPLGGDEQGGEGWSDFIGLYMTLRSGDLGAATAEHPNGTLPAKGLGTYVHYENINGKGIRPERYNINKTAVPHSFKDIGKGAEITIPHGVGYIWCQMLYSMEQEFIDMYGFNDNIYEPANPTPDKKPPVAAKGNNIAMRLVVEGMKLQPTSPTFQEQRDAILAADELLYDGRHTCIIWKAFAKWGLGFSAKSNSNGVGDEVEGYDVPPTCDPTQVNLTLNIDAADKVNNGNNIVYSIKVKNPFTNNVDFVVTSNQLPVGTKYISSLPAGTNAGGIVTWPATTLSPGEEKTFSITAQVLVPSAGTELFYDDNEDGETGWTKSTLVPTDNWSIVTSKVNSGTKGWFAPDVDGVSNMMLQTANKIAIPAGGAELVFFHSYATESGFDGGVVETSTDGVVWNYLPPNKFVKNGYNGIIPIANNPLIGTSDQFAFTGTSQEGFITSIANLNDYAGQSIYIRFRMTSDVATTVEGWYIDDVFVMVGRTEIINVSMAKGSNNSDFTAPLDEESFSQTTFVFGASMSPLSADLSELKAKPESNVIKLDWTTLQENNVNGFEVERQSQTETTFTSAGFVKSKGNNVGKTVYNFIDNNVIKNTLYSYRIKMVNMDGSVKYTNIATAKIGEATAFGFALSPNPATNNITIAFNNPVSEKAILKIYDVSGKLLTTLNMGNINGTKTNINVAGFTNGVYWLELNDNGLKQTERLVIQR